MFLDENTHFYLAGPMSGYPDMNFPAFEAAQRHLESCGLIVVSPHDVNKHLTSEQRAEKPREHWIKLDFALMMKCEALILLPGWEESSGARRELDIALDLKWPVFLYNNDRSLYCITNKSAIKNLVEAGLREKVS